MESRSDFRKKNNRNNLYLIVGALVIVIALIGGFAIHNHNVAEQAKARTFAKNHFNPNVTIYGVKVGNLTVEKATEKINQKANNTIKLKNDKLSESHDSSIQTITTNQVEDYFNKQHTDLPNKQNYKYDSAEYDKGKDKLKNINKSTLTYSLDGNNYELKADELIDEATYKNGKIKFNDVDKLTAKLKEINKKHGTLHKSYQIFVPNDKKVKGKKITVKNKSYGWDINIDKAERAIEQAFMTDQKRLDGKDYIYGTGYSTYAHGYGKSNHGLGDSYVVVSIKNQELWIVRKGKLVVHLNDVVTGTYVGGKGNRTPTGVWYIQYKESPSVLRGLNDDGSKYASKVQYWMPFTLSGCGLHDASWRTDWTKKAYLNGGSHGCVNIRPSEITEVWNNVITNEPVIVYN